MNNLNITDVRAVPGDAAFLIDDGKTAILYDTGFGFTGYKIAENIRKTLGNRSLDYIFLTHSHYDHAVASAYVRKMYPNVQVVAGEYAVKIFSKPSARAVMRDMDRKAAGEYGAREYEDLIDELHVDISVSDGDLLICGDLTFQVIALPGHTRCSVGFYLAAQKLLLGSETLGVYFGKDTYLPSYLVGYQMTMDSFEKAKKLEIDHILLPHYGVVHHEEAKNYLRNSEKVAIDTAQTIKEMLQSGKSKAEITQYFKQTIYTPTVRPTYPIDAFLLNTGIMIDLIQKELLPT